LEAVQKAEELRPDLIVLDIGLPSLNGIDAARRVHKLLPKSKMLFVSQESSADVVQEALALGALGYVVKAHAGSELLPAVEAVLQGRQFVGSGLSGQYLSPMSDSKTLDRTNEPSSSPVSERREITPRHGVEFYSDDAGFVGGFTRFIETALGCGKAVIVVATDSHQKSLLQRLQEHGVDMGAAVEQGRYVSLDVADALSAFMVNGQPDPARFQTVVDNLVVPAAKASKGDSPGVAICGECASALWEQGKADAAFEGFAFGFERRPVAAEQAVEDAARIVLGEHPAVIGRSRLRRFLRIVDVSLSNDDEAILGLYADDIESSEAGQPAQVGIDALRAKFAGWRSMTTNNAFEPRRPGVSCS